MQMEMSNYNEIIRIIFELLALFDEMAIAENVYSRLWRNV